MNKKIIFFILILLGVFFLASLFLFRENKNLRRQIYEKNKAGISEFGNDHSRSDLPKGYTLKSYKVEKISTTTCQNDSDCQTPMEYLIQSRCPFTSLCLKNKCSVICPDYSGQ